MAKSPLMKCKVCDGEHAGTICTKFTSVRVLPPFSPQPQRLALPAPVKNSPPKASKKAEVAGSIPASSRVASADGGNDTKRAAARGNRSQESVGGIATVVAQAGRVPPPNKKAKTTDERKAYLAEAARKRRQREKTAKCTTCAGTGRVDGGERGEVQEVCQMCLIVREK